MLLKDLLNSFEKAMIIDFNKQRVWVINKGKVRVYPKKYYKRLVDNFNFGEEFA